jgi:hypothetical protein
LREVWELWVIDVINILDTVLDQANNVSGKISASIFRWKGERGILFWWTLKK